MKNKKEAAMAEAALQEAYPQTPEGMADLLHAHLYLGHAPAYIYKLRQGINMIVDDGEVLTKIEEVDEITDDMIGVVVKNTAMQGIMPETNVYHAKVLRLEDAEQIVSVDEDLNLGELPKSIIPYEKCRKVILENPDHLCVIDCICRTLLGDKGCYPRDVCIFVGEPWVTWIMTHNESLHPRRITQEEALEIIRSQHEMGHVQATFFKDATNGRMYHICNCCKCCCTAIRAQNYAGASLYSGSGAISVIQRDKCTDCGKCVEFCNFNAISMKDGHAFVDTEICMGCGACETLCPEKACIVTVPENSELLPLDLKAVRDELGK